MNTGPKTELLKDFFNERIREVRRNQGLRLQEPTQMYVVNMLSNFLHTDRLFSTQENGDEPIALMYGRALGATSVEQFQIFKIIGDRTLYLSGFFGDSFKRKLVDIDYYISMGEQAYGSVSSISKEDKGNVYRNVFEELSEKFVKLVDLLGEISESAMITSDSDLLRIYERWLMTKSDRLSKKLQEAGIILTETSKEPIH